MAKTRKYPLLKIEEFGAHLLGTGDLDPIYLALHRASLPPGQLRRLLLSYWCFYNVGLASYLSEQSEGDFWGVFKTAAANHPSTPAPIGSLNPLVNGGWPRGAERRHFRGLQSIKAADELALKYPNPELAIAGHLVREGDPDRLPYQTVLERAQEWRGFGDWISFKVGDMLDRCGVHPVDFGFDDAMYETPTAAAVMQWKVWHNAPEASTIDDEKAAVREVAVKLTEIFSHIKAPPLNDRPIGFQEVETILCKWKSHMGGSYPLFNDIDEIRHGLSPWAGHSETAKKLLACMPERK